MWNWCYHKLPSFVYVHFGFQLRINTLSQLKHVDNEFTMFSCESQRFIFCGCNKITLVHLNRNSAYTRRITVICIYSVIHVYYNCIQIAKLNRIWEWNLNYSLPNGEKTPVENWLRTKFLSKQLLDRRKQYVCSRSGIYAD